MKQAVPLFAFAYFIPFVAMAVGLAVLGLLTAKRSWDGYRGLNQWPNPYGRHYNEWLALRGETEPDYYTWLANRMGNKEPWRAWAQAHQELAARHTWK